jgi:hypothetical protein
MRWSFVASLTRPAVVALLIVVVLFGAAAALGLGRAGYSIDEEYTLFSVRGIGAHGVPLLPSGAFHDRGLPYTYAAWLSGALFGHGWAAYRFPSFVSGVIAILFAFRLALTVQRRPTLALLAVAAVAAMPWTIFSAQWARFYGMFAAVLLISILLFLRYERTRRGLWWWLASIWLAHLLHEFAVLLILLPVVVWMLRDGEQAMALPMKTIGLAAAAFAASEATVILLHFTVSGASFRTLQDYAALHALPVGWETPFEAAEPDQAYPLFDADRWSRLLAMAPRTLIGATVGVAAALLLRVSRLLGAAHGALAATGQFSRIWLVGTLWAFSRPRSAGRTLIWTAAIALAGALIALLDATWGAGATLSLPLATGIVGFAFREAASGISGLLLDYPGSTACLAAAAAVAMLRHRSGSSEPIRLLLLWVMWWLLAFNILQVDFKPRYYAPLWLLFAIAVIAAPGLIPARWLRSRRAAIAGRLAMAVTFAAIVTWEQYEAVDENRSSRCVAGDSICVPMLRAYDTSELAGLRNGVGTADLVLCGDELLCLLELGRVDYWLYSGTIFRHSTPHGAVGLFGGAPIVGSLGELQAILARDPAARFWIVIPTLPKYSTWDVDAIVSAIPEERRAGIQVIRTAGATIVAPA